MSLSTLPTEIILHIASFVAPHLQSLSSFSQTNQHLLSIIEPILYTEDVRRYNCSCVYWAAKQGRLATLRKALALGGVHIPIRLSRSGMIRRRFARLYGKNRLRTYWKDEIDHPICIATRYGHEEIVRFLLDNIGCSPHIRDHEDFSLLSLAVICGQNKQNGSSDELIKMFLDLNVQQTDNGFNPHSPIQIAAYLGDGNAVRLLLSEKRNIPTKKQIQDAFKSALEAGHLPVALQLLDHGMDLNFTFFREPGEDRPYLPTPLGWATYQGHRDLVEKFLYKGAAADFTTRPYEDKVVLWDAVKRKQAEMVEILVKMTTNRVVRTKALALAVDLASPDDQVVSILLRNGVRCNFEEGDRRLPHPVDLARPNESQVVEDSPNGDFVPPIVLAVNSGRLDLVRLLVSHGADVNAGCDELRVTESRMYCERILNLGMALGYQAIVAFLLESGAKPVMEHPGLDNHHCWAPFGAAVDRPELRRRA